MGLILWIDQNTFATGLFERVFKKKALPFYTISSVDDFAYLVDDLNPAVIVLDQETFAKNPEGFKRQYEQSAKMQEVPFILLDPKEDFSFIKVKAGEIHRPIEPFDLPDYMAKIISVH